MVTNFAGYYPVEFPKNIHQILELSYIKSEGINPFNPQIIRGGLGILQQLLELLGVPLGIRANLSKKLNCRPDVLLGPGKRLRLLDSNLKEGEFRAAKILPRYIETTVNAQQLTATSHRSIFFLYFLCLAQP